MRYQLLSCDPLLRKACAFISLYLIRKFIHMIRRMVLSQLKTSISGYNCRLHLLSLKLSYCLLQLALGLLFFLCFMYTSNARPSEWSTIGMIIMINLTITTTIICCNCCMQSLSFLVITHQPGKVTYSGNDFISSSLVGVANHFLAVAIFFEIFHNQHPYQLINMSPSVEPRQWLPCLEFTKKTSVVSKCVII